MLEIKITSKDKFIHNNSCKQQSGHQNIQKIHPFPSTLLANTKEQPSSAVK